jgi:hypothetical protein
MKSPFGLSLSKPYDKLRGGAIYARVGLALNDLNITSASVT